MQITMRRTVRPLYTREAPAYVVATEHGEQFVMVASHALNSIPPGRGYIAQSICERNGTMTLLSTLELPLPPKGQLEWAPPFAITESWRAVSANNLYTSCDASLSPHRIGYTETVIDNSADPAIGAVQGKVLEEPKCRQSGEALLALKGVFPS